MVEEEKKERKKKMKMKTWSDQIWRRRRTRRRG